MKIALINTPSPFLGNDLLYPALGVLYIAAALDRAQIEYDFYDCAGLPEIDIPKKYDMYLFTATTPQYPLVKKFAQNVEGIKIIGGAHPTAMPRQCLDDGFNGVFIGEAESCIDQILDIRVDSNRIINQIECNDLDNIDFPNRKVLDMKRYDFKVADFDTFTSIISSRGCAFKCAFCSNSVRTVKMRFRSPKNFLQEVDVIKDTYGINNFIIYDDLFGMHPEIESIIAGLGDRGCKWRCLTRTDKINQNRIDLMATNGCVEIDFGVESGSQYVLDKNNKRSNVLKNIQAIRMAKHAGIIAKAFLMYGLPYDNKESIELTKIFLDIAKPDVCTLSLFIPLPGTSIWNHPERFEIEIVDRDFNKYFTVGRDVQKKAIIRNKYCNENELMENFMELKAYIDTYHAPTFRRR